MTALTLQEEEILWRTTGAWDQIGHRPTEEIL